MAHPYAPMGGSHDDRVVGIVIDEFLKAGWIIGTFNFRGAHGSQGRTSWSGRPELDDYTSFAAFFMHYLSYLRPHPASNANLAAEIPSKPSPTGQSEQVASGQAAETPTIILGGYSYGSLILKHLPPVPMILQPFESPIAGSAHDEVVLKAHKLADQSNLAWINLARRKDRERRLAKKGHGAKPSVTMGGEETSPDKRRTSRDIRRSVDRGLSVDFGNRLRSLSHRRRKDESPVTSLERTDASPITMPEVRYLLVSQLTTPTSTLAAPALVHKFWNKTRERFQDVLSKHATLAIYGDQDMFASAKKLRSWCAQMRDASRVHFSSVEVTGAGHFWVEKGVEAKLRAALRDWATAAHDACSTCTASSSTAT
ncbi:hypothetical protein CC86DRAFT_298621 [Ophiobolus disseminans]|uniref:AB hydrolase-1 domain-containing protein n=1 Tax=Ophiobolus disseminans TaxID=1469910 RepID=A0A6A6ZQ65_9PLEO|nr:hypothetical protein CC86DRAFT_298621 [Ophiobolus disseminans]